MLFSPSALCKNVLTLFQLDVNFKQLFHVPQKVCEPQEENDLSPPAMVRPLVGRLSHLLLCVVEVVFVVLRESVPEESHSTASF